MNICVVTGSRADYGYLVTLMELIRDNPGCALQVAVTGMHLWEEYGDTWRDIEADGFAIDVRVKAPFKGTEPEDVARYTGRLIEGFSEALKRLAPDIVVLLGDRYEIFAAAQAVLFMRIPLAHLAGGDMTEGAYDEAMRHSITKIAHLHFVTNAQAGKRVVQLGENPSRVHVVGSTSLDLLKNFKPLSRSELERELDFEFRNKNLLVTFHPATLDAESPESQARELLAALDEWAAGGEAGVIFTAPNADAEGLGVRAALDEFAGQRPWAKVFDSLGREKYFSAVLTADAVVGNSSSGLYEVPSLGRPTVDIGDRQKGRLRAASVVHCEPRREQILDAIKRALDLDCSNVVNPYGQGDASQKILEILLEVEPRKLLKKEFYDLP